MIILWNPLFEVTLLLLLFYCSDFFVDSRITFSISYSEEKRKTRRMVMFRSVRIFRVWETFQAKFAKNFNF